MVMRIGGLASGMDIDSIVEKLMQAEKAPLNKLYQNKQKYEWQRDAYREVNTKLKAFEDYLRDEMTLQSTFYKKKVESSNSAVSAVPTTAQNGQALAIDEVSKLAKSGNAVGTIDTSKSTMAELGLAGTEQVEMHVLQTDGTMKQVKFDINETDTIDQVVSKLKNDAGLNAFYDKASGQISISTKATGKGDESTEYNITTNSGGYPTTTTTVSDASVFVTKGNSVFDKLGFGDDSALITNGQNAKLTINGAEIERKSNTFDIDGFRVTLNDTYTNTNGQPVNLTAKVDADHMVDKIKKFVDTYNGLIDSMHALVKEPKYRDYAPLTDEQKKDMDDKEVEAWEKKAKSGILRNDLLLNSTLNTLRATMYSKGGGKQDVRATADAPAQNFINTLYEMGITTTDKTADRGKLKINEEELRAAIEKDPEQVYATFSDPKNDNGIVQRLRKDLSSTVRQIEKKAGKADSTNISFQIGRQINSADDRIDSWKSKLANIEARYWKQFTAMETAINKANQQSSSLFSGQAQ